MAHIKAINQTISSHLITSSFSKSIMKSSLKISDIYKDKIIDGWLIANGLRAELK